MAQAGPIRSCPGNLLFSGTVITVSLGRFLNQGTVRQKWVHKSRERKIKQAEGETPGGHHVTREERQKGRHRDDGNGGLGPTLSGA